MATVSPEIIAAIDEIGKRDEQLRSRRHYKCYCFFCLSSFTSIRRMVICSACFCKLIHKAVGR